MTSKFNDIDLEDSKLISYHKMQLTKNKMHPRILTNGHR